MEKLLSVKFLFLIPMHPEIKQGLRDLKAIEKI